jgi:hypothetical protein
MRNGTTTMKTDVDSALKDIADFYIKNRRGMTEPELEAIVLKHCESEAEVRKFVSFLETEPGQLRFKTLLRERKELPRQSSNPDEEKPLEFLNGYAVPLRERAPIEDRTRKLLLAELNSEWTSSMELLKAIQKKRRVYIDMEWALHVLLDELLPEGKVGQATFYGSVASWWNNQPLSCPKCRSWEVDQFFTEGGILIQNHCTKCDLKWGGWEKPSYLKESFVKVGDRVRYIGEIKGRSGTWPEGVWLEKGMEGTVTEYHPPEPEVVVRGERFEAIPAWAVVKFDNGASTGINPEDEGKRWEKPSYLKEASKERMPRIDPHATAIQQDKQLIEQIKWLKAHGFKTAREAQEAGY